jgi:hypothetical protein
MKAALGLRAHSGWTAAVVVAGPPASPAILDRRRLILADAAELEGSKQPYHAAEARGLPEAQRMIARCREDAERRAWEGLRATLEAAAAAGHRIECCGLLFASGRALPGLEKVLASHALIHTAEGEHFRGALTAAARRLSLSIAAVPEREVEARAAAAAGVSEKNLKTRIAGLGKTLGPPWTQDQKLAALAGLLALVAG